jgi:hypothetical protein
MARPVSVSADPGPDISDAGVSLAVSGPWRSRVPQMIAPAAKMPAVHQNAVS